MNAFEEEVTKFDLGFTSVLISLLDKISQLARENYNERILNILHRLDFNGFYSKALDTFRGHSAKEISSAAPASTTTSYHT
jgi:gamma-tubulin complex component 2